MRKRAVLCSMIWAVIRHEEPEGGAQFRCGGSWQAFGKDRRIKREGYPKQRKQIYKGWS